MDREELVQEIEDKIWNMITAGGGDADTVNELANEIADLMEDKDD
jgi:hypothetical protein